MATIFNKRDQKITINLLGGRSRDLLAKSAMDIPDTDLASSHLRTLQMNGDIMVIEASQAKKEKPESVKRDGMKTVTEKKATTTATATPKKESPKIDPNQVETNKAETHRKPAPKK